MRSPTCDALPVDYVKVAGRRLWVRFKFAPTIHTPMLLETVLRSVLSLATDISSLSMAPQSLARRMDRLYLQGADEYSIIYSPERGYSGEKPAQITHQAIEDSFLEKASSLWYFSDGKWYKLPGAD